MKKTKRLFWQLYPSYLLIILILGGAMSWFTAGSLARLSLGRFKADLVTQARLLSPQVIDYLKRSETSAIDDLCKKVGALASTRITVILPTGRVIGDSEKRPDQMERHSNRPEIIQAREGTTGVSIRYSRTLEKKMMYVALPLEENGHVLGILRTSLPLTEIDAEVKTIRIRLAVGGLVIALIASFICYVMSRRISRPVEDLRRGAAFFARGELGHRLPVPRTTELADLADAMNSMARHLESRMETIVSQRNEYETVLSSMTEGVIAVDTAEVILSVNQAGAGMLERNISDIKGRSIQEVIRNRDFQQFVIDAVHEKITVKQDVDLYLKQKRILNVHATPLSDARENRIGTLLVLNEVTQLRHLEHMRRDFVANVSHEIRTPLTAIKGFVETLAGGAVDSREETVRFLGIIGRHVDRLGAIVEGLLQLSRLEKEKKGNEIRFELSLVHPLIKTAIGVCRGRAEARGVTVNLMGEENIHVAVDGRLFEQAVVNLLDNAINYSSGEGGQVRIVVSRTREEAIIAVADDGIGIEKKHLHRLFERFYRVDKARSCSLGGTGLGLAIVKHIVQAHNGHVTVTSAPGQGSTFSIHLPLA